MHGRIMELIIGKALLGLLLLWLSVVIMAEIQQTKEAQRWLLKRNQARKLRKKRNCQNYQKNEND